MEMLNHPFIRARLLALAIVISIAILIEVAVYFIFLDAPIIRVKLLGLISLGLIGFLLHTSYQVWDWFNDPFKHHDLQ